jgi:hypothetical protein
MIATTAASIVQLWLCGNIPSFTYVNPRACGDYVTVSYVPPLVPVLSFLEGRVLSQRLAVCSGDPSIHGPLSKDLRPTVIVSVMANVIPWTRHVPNSLSALVG